MCVCTGLCTCAPRALVTLAVFDVQLILGRVAEVATQFDDNGINIRFMNSTVEGNNVRDSVSAAGIAQQVCYATQFTPSCHLLALPVHCICNGRCARRQARAAAGSLKVAGI